jgi:hypothetical protein
MAIQRPFDVQSELLESPSVAAPRAVEEGFGRSADIRPHQCTFAWAQLLL